MCGIAGLAGRPPGAEPLEASASRMNDALRHRGPDGAGRFAPPTGPVALAMRRLAIIDVEGGRQPIENETRTVAVVFNGEIYNFPSLRAELERAGHAFRTRSDTEVIVHGYEEWGLQVLHRLRGMFAIALWDESRRRLLLARDRLGIKPLYVWHRREGLAFASELKALRLLPDFPQQPDPEAVLRYLALGYVPDPLSIYPGVRKLPPGHYLLWSADEGVSEHRYWDPVRPEAQGLDEEEAARELRRLLEDAIRSHLISDVPLGAFLSGGLDSSTVVAQMARLTAMPVRTFTIGFDEAEYDEAPGAALVARALRTDHTERVMRVEADTLVEELALWFDEPFADWSALPTYLVAKLAREQVTVALSGDGGDELFGGYTRYRAVPRPGREPTGAHRALALLARHLPQGARGRNYLINLGRSAEGRYASTVALPLPRAEGGVVRDELVDERLGLDLLLREWFARTDGRDFAARMALVDVMSYLPGDILTKVDRMTMKVSLEARVPLLDHHLVEFALALPSRLKLRDGTGKWLFRKAVADLVPPEVLAKRKQGFAVPYARWFRGPLRPRLEALGRADSPVYRYLDPGALRRVRTEHLRGRRDHSYLLWRTLILHRWLSGTPGAAVPERRAQVPA